MGDAETLLICPTYPRDQLSVRWVMDRKKTRDVAKPMELAQKCLFLFCVKYYACLWNQGRCISIFKGLGMKPLK